MQREELAREILLRLLDSNAGAETDIASKAISIADDFLSKLVEQEDNKRFSTEGFCTLPNTRTIVYVGGENKSLWYFYDFDNEKQIPISKPVLKGVLEGVKISEVPYKGKTNIKLDLLIKSGQKAYTLRSGIDTTFAKGALQALWQVSSFKSELIFRPELSEKAEKVVFCKIYENSKYIKYDWVNINCRETAQALQKRIAEEIGSSSIGAYETQDLVETEQKSDVSEVDEDFETYEAAPNIEESIQTSEFDYNDNESLISLKEKSTQLMNELKLSAQEGRQKIFQKYGVRSRDFLSREQMEEFIEHLEHLQKQHLAATN